MTQQKQESAFPGVAQASEAIRHLILAIDGLHCANCVGRVEHNLLRVDGVRRATVNLVQERADIDYDPALTTPTLLMAAVQKAGYRAEAWRGAGGQRHRDRLTTARVVICLLLALPFLLEMGNHLLPWFSFHLPPLVALGLASVVQFWGGWPLYTGAWRALRQRTLNTDVLAALGASVAYAVSLWHIIAGQGALSFEASTLIISFILLGRWLEALMRRKAVAAVHHLVALQPQQVRCLKAGGTEVMVALPEVAVGDNIVVWTGERVPLDGDITDGLATFDYSLLTGETSPRVLGVGEAVIAGALCLNGSVKLKVTNHAGQTILDHLADMVAVAQASHPLGQRLTDVAAKYFILAVLLVAALSFVFWGAQGDLARAQQAALAVLLMACPCALGLAVPMVVAIAVGQAARHGILIRDAAALERAATVTTVIFDKTGTLSSGVPDLAETVSFGTFSSDQILAYAAALNRQVNHPVAAGLRKIVAERAVPLALPELRGETQIIFGRGVQGNLTDGTTVICGNLAYMLENQIQLEDAAATAAAWEDRGRLLTWVAAVAPQRRLLGLMSFRDAMRPEAPAAIDALTQNGINLSILSGDNKNTALSMAKRLGIGHVIGEALPQDKLQEIQKRQKWGEIVAMVGDGMNDAPALARADLGIAMQGGVDAADAAAPVRLLRDDLRLIPAFLALAKMAHGIMLLNLWWAVIFNLIALPLAAFGVVPPALAVLAMTASSLLVILQSLTLKLWRPHA